MNQPDPLVIEETVISSFHDRYNVSCFGTQDGSITLQSITGGHEDRGFWFDWAAVTGSNISDTARRNQTGLGAGSYHVEVSDTFNCSTSATYDLIQPEELSVLAELSESLSGSHNLNCFGDHSGYIILHPEGGDTEDSPYQFFWEQGGTSSELHNITAGDYIVTVTDGIQCSITDTVRLTQPDPLNVDSAVFSDYNGYAVSCAAGNDGTILIFTTGGTGRYGYTWTTGGEYVPGDSSYIGQLRPGQYQVIITDDNNCETTW